MLLDKTKNQINVIYPYRTKGGTWVYDDPDVPVFAEAFVMGSSELIDMLVGKECNNFVAFISSKPLPEPTVILDNIDTEETQALSAGLLGWYQMRGTDHKNWLCGHVKDYFPDYPKQIYVKIEK
jgi:hypothetical protein